MYWTPFTLSGDVQNRAAAQDYLVDDDMLQFLQGDVEGGHVPAELGSVTSITWVLTSNSSGVVLLESPELPDAALTALSEWIRGQNSDGLGEGFEQQDPYYSGTDFKGRSFNWEDSDYTLQPVSDAVVEEVEGLLVNKDYAAISNYQRRL